MVSSRSHHSLLSNIHPCTKRYSYTWGTARKHGFHGVFLGDLERLQDIQRKRDKTNRDWQRTILRNIATALAEEEDYNGTNKSQPVFETRQLWWQIHTRMQSPGYGNMLLLIKMREHLEMLMYERKQRFLTMAGYNSIIDKLHLDAEGCVVEPFVSLSCSDDRSERKRQWDEALALDLEEECLIK